MTTAHTGTYIIRVPMVLFVGPDMFAGCLAAFAVAYCLNCIAPALWIFVRAKAERMGERVKGAISISCMNECIEVESGVRGMQIAFFSSRSISQLFEEGQSML
ncbi:hypothetical protein B0O99DRAFT_607775 [Bisporella sp. PMI_857]|nr:hypothetical protein B0O99DRAFT_607775 [Bisporella sp. PMI_857]